MRPATLFLLSCLTASLAGAQPGWHPPIVDDWGPKLTGANRATARAHIASLERLLKQIPELAHTDWF